MEPYRNMTCILRVDTQSPGWEKSLTKVIKQIKDVSYTIDATQGIVRISGAIDPNTLLTDIKKVGKHAELLAADIGGSSNGGSGGGNYHFHPNSNHGNRYGYNEYNGNHDRGYHYHNEYNGNHDQGHGYGYNEYNGNHDRGYNYNEHNGNRGRGHGYNEYSGGYENVVPKYNHIECQSDLYRSNGVLAQPAQEQLQLQHYYDTNNNCVIM